MATLEWLDLRARGACHVGRRAFASQRTFPLHNHDFAELCWVERGEVIHLTTASQTTLRVGDVVFVRPEHYHGLRGGAHGGVLVNIAFPAAELDALADRYADTHWPWGPSQQPQYRRLPLALVAHVSARAIALSPSDASRQARDALILTILAAAEQSAEQRWPGVPMWLSDAFGQLCG